MPNAAEKAAMARKAAAKEKERRKKRLEEDWEAREAYHDNLRLRILFFVCLGVTFVGLLSSIFVFAAMSTMNPGLVAFGNVMFWFAVVALIVAAIAGTLTLVLWINLNLPYDHDYGAHKLFITKLGMCILDFGIMLTCLIAVIAYHVNGVRGFKGEVTEAGVTYRIYEDGAKVTGGEKDIENVVIPEYINNYPVTVIGANAFKDNRNLKTVKITGDIDVNDNAFEGCTGLTSFSVENGNLILRNECFINCRSLNNVYLKSGELKWEWSPGRSTDYPFKNCAGNLVLDLDDYAVKLDVMYNGHMLTAFETIKMGGTSSIDTVDTPNVKNLVLKDGFICGNNAIRVETGIFATSWNALANRIYIPMSIKNIGDGLFGDRLPDHYSTYECFYAGNISQWGDVTVNSNHNGLYTGGRVLMHYETSFSA